MIAWFAKNAYAANFLLLIIVAAGVYTTLFKIPLEISPADELEEVIVSISQRAATPEDMERGVTIMVESALADLPYVDELVSSSASGLSQVIVKLDTGTDTQKALNEIKGRIDALSNLPSSAERAVIEAPVETHEVLSIVIYGALDEAEMATIARAMRNDIVRHEGVSQARVAGVRGYQISIEITQATLRAYNLTLADIAQAINGQAIDLSAGQLRSDNGDIILRSKNQAYNFDDFHNIVLRRFEDGSVLTLGQIANVNDGFDESSLLARFNGQRAVFVDVYRVGTESAIGVSDAVKDYLVSQRHRYPDTVKLDIWDDDSRYVKERLSTLLTSGWQGALLIIILLTLFLHHKVALWVVVGIPVCFAGTLAFFPAMGVTLNMVSLFAFIMVLGVVVDDAIVTGENIYSHRMRGASGIDAAINGTHEVAVPVVFGVVTTMLAFVPMLMLTGGAASFGWNIATGVIVTLAFSLIETKFILPAHLSRLQLHTKPTNPAMAYLEVAQNTVAGFLQYVLKTWYQPFLFRCLQRRYLTLLSFSCLLVVIVSLTIFGWVRYSFMPIVAAERASADIHFPAGTPLHITHAAIDRMEQTAFAMREQYRQPNGDSLVENIIAFVGGKDKGWVSFEVSAEIIEASGLTIGDIVHQWRDGVGLINGVEELKFHATLIQGNKPIAIDFFGNDSAQMIKVMAQTKVFLAGFDGVFDIDDSLFRGKPELQITLRAEAEILGLTLDSVTRQVRNAFFGAQAQRIQRGSDDVRVMVNYPLAERNSLAHLDNLLITTPAGEETRFSDIATVHWGHSPTNISRKNQLRTATVSADIHRDTVVQSALVHELKTFVAALLVNYPNISYSMGGDDKIEKEANVTLKFGAIGLLVAIFALLTVAFKSYSQPLIIMSVIPFAYIGAVIGHIVTGVGMSMFSIFGILALIGIVVNDSLVLVDWINRRVRAGEPIVTVVNAAGGARFRAILLTSLTTFFGLLPVLFQSSAGAQFLIPMATSLGFGILFATMITLILVPCNFLILDDISTLKQRWFGADTDTTAVNHSHPVKIDEPNDKPL